MRHLATLVRLHRSRLDEARRELADLARLGDDWRDRAARFESAWASEHEAAAGSAEGAWAYGGFVRAALDRRRQLVASMAEVEARIAAAGEAVATAFEDLKRYEIGLETRTRAAHAAAERQAQAVLDEVGADMYRRRPD
ncbi:MAG: hypothetical protein ACT4P2_03025 [Pseudomonadota bacterium]